MNAPALLIAGTHSGCGKTTVTLGLMAALRRRGLTVRPFKCGPDFIDPSLHRMVCGTLSYNLDCRMCGEDFVRTSFGRHNPPGDHGIAVVEGVMGLFDGGTGSAAHLAKTLGLPVLLVVDVRSAAESVAAVVKGFATLDPELSLSGVICNRVASARHEALIRGAMAQTGVPIVGFLPREERIAIPSRHLGLNMGEEEPLGPAALERLAALVEEQLDISGVLALAERAAVQPAVPPGAGLLRPCRGQAGPGLDNDAQDCGPVRLGVARDAAFCFYYEDNLELLSRAGAELLFFSPLADAELPAGLGGLYLGGGYPELFAERLSGNTALRAAVLDFSRRGAPVYGECGGFMYLCETLQDLDGHSWPMAGVFPFACVMNPRLRSLGYREPEQRRATFFGPAGMRLFGHEFHYSSLSSPPQDGAWQDGGYTRDKTLAGYIHLHWGRTPEAAAALVQACRAFVRQN